MSGPALGRWYRCITDVGRVRTSNEDFHGEFALPDGGVLLVVCDGMGGHEAGEVASAIAVETIGRVFTSRPNDDPRDRLFDGFVEANANILAEAVRPGEGGMGTTGVAAFARDDEVYVAHVGDSRLYHLRGGEVAFRTKDHTRVQKMVDEGILSEEEAHSHPDANVLVRALGHQDASSGEPSDPEPDVRKNPLRLEPGDAIMLCSDGLYDLVQDDEVGATLAGKNAEEGAQALVDLANSRGGHDNITVSVLLYGQELGAVPARPPGPPMPSGPSTPATPNASSGLEVPSASSSSETVSVPSSPARRWPVLALTAAGFGLLVLLVLGALILWHQPASSAAARDAGFATSAPGAARDTGVTPNAGVTASSRAVGDGGSLSVPAAAAAPGAVDGARPLRKVNASVTHGGGSHGRGPDAGPGTGRKTPIEPAAASASHNGGARPAKGEGAPPTARHDGG
jgi:serine/threonine protein phosphatase PrpC